MLTLDSTTRAAYDAAATADARAQAVLDALTGTVNIKVYNGSGSVMGSGTIAAPWATRSANVLTLGQTRDFSVTTSGTPDSTWYLRLESAGKWVKGTFGLTGSGADFLWSLSTWASGQLGTIGTATGTVQTTTATSDLTTSYSVAGATITFGWNIPNVTQALTGASASSAFTRDISSYVNVPPGVTPAYAVTAQTKDGTAGSYGITVSQTGTLSFPSLSAGTYTVTVDLTQAASSAEADWTARKSGAGVVWAHDFRYASELTQFYQNTALGGEAPTGSPPSIVADGPTGYSLKYTNPVHGQALGLWARPLSALRTPGNGLPTDDPAAGNPSRLRTWNPASASSTAAYISGWRYGWYGHSDYHTPYRNPTLSVNGTATSFTDVWEGSELYIQFRCKISASRFDPLNTEGGKLWFLDTAPVTGGDLQQLVGSLEVNDSFTYSPTTNFHKRFGMFTSYGSKANSRLTDPQGGPQGAAFFPGSSYTAVSGPPWPPTGSVWAYPTDEWFTVLLRVKPGHGVVTSVIGNPTLLSETIKDTEIEVWVARSGETSYTQIYRKTDLGWLFGANTYTSGDYSEILPGFNFFRPTSYCNIPDGATGPAVEYSYQFTQVILSQAPIACPQA